MDLPASSSQYAAVDLGSNSFHMVVAELYQGRLRVIDRIREPVRLAAGLTKSQSLNKRAQDRAIQCLQRFGERLRHIQSDRVRAVGTNTLRKAKNAVEFLHQAQKALGHPIGIISGLEEGRLIYQAVDRSIPTSEQRRLVVDIGGGSTELIIGEGAALQTVNSLYMGCVSFSHKFFPNGHLYPEAFEDAEIAAGLELQPLRRRYRALGWDLSLGTSGTIKAIHRLVQSHRLSPSGDITAKSLDKIKQWLIDAKHIDNLHIESLEEERKAVLAGGISILSAVFRHLKIRTMQSVRSALREGLLYSMLEHRSDSDPRQQTIQSLSDSYGIDQHQAQRVAAVAQHLFEGAQIDWGLQQSDAQLLNWAAQVHEIGLSVQHSGYHKHSAYILQHADLPGFTRGEQRLLATIVRHHRGGLRKTLLETLPRFSRRNASRLIALLRLAYVLCRSRKMHLPDLPRISIENEAMILHFLKQWTQDHPFTLTNLHQTEAKLAKIKIRCRLRFDNDTEV